jgi:16S rRNA (adenine1518-N6/adenine1519-N6)-dimethyltransferase
LIHIQARNKIKPRKSLGQHFLKKPAILRNIVSNAELNKDDVVVEIGAGMGDLTAFIAQEAKVVVALELDPNLMGILKHKFAKNNNVFIVCEDALTFNYEQIAKRHNTLIKIIGNIPYYLSTALTTKLLTMRSIIVLILFMFQKEVAERIIAEPGSKSYGPLSIISKIYAHTTKLMDIERAHFYPPPNIDSVLLKFELYQKPRISLDDEKYFEMTLYSIFAHRRKTLLNSLTALGQRTKDEVFQLCKAVNIDPMRRAETLTIEEIDRLMSSLRIRGG